MPRLAVAHEQPLGFGIGSSGMAKQISGQNFHISDRLMQVNDFSCIRVFCFSLERWRFYGITFPCSSGWESGTII